MTRRERVSEEERPTRRRNATHHASVELIEVFDAVQVLQDLRRDGRAKPKDGNLAVFCRSRKQSVSARSRFKHTEVTHR